MFSWISYVWHTEPSCIIYCGASVYVTSIVWNCNSSNQNKQVNIFRKGKILPEVMHELFELVCASGQRDNDVDWDIDCVHPLVFHLQQWSKGTEEDQTPEFIAWLPSEGQLVQRPFVPLCAGDTWWVRPRDINSWPNKLSFCDNQQVNLFITVIFSISTCLKEYDFLISCWQLDGKINTT